jgi:hypothetical protein
LRQALKAGRKAVLLWTWRTMAASHRTIQLPNVLLTTRQY